MDLLLQFGYGMMGHTRELLERWSGGTVILSPRDLEEDQIIKFGWEIADNGGTVLLDPQCFARDADHERLLRHEYFKEFRSNPTGSFSAGSGAMAVVKALAILNRKAGIKRHILPGTLTDDASDDWFAFQEGIIREAPKCFGQEELIGTLALSALALGDETIVEAIVERVARWPLSAIYLVAEHPEGYLVKDPVWMANLLILTSGLSLAGKRVIVGYSSHQMLCLAASGVQAIASGTWMNVRSFPLDKFYSPEDEIRRKTVWYYASECLSEYKIPTLDIAKRQGLLHLLKTPPHLDGAYAEPLFGAATPTNVAWGEPNAFRHYLTVLRGQVRDLKYDTFDATRAACLSQLDLAESTLKKLKAGEVTGQDRDFAECVDVCKAALAVMTSARGARLRRHWNILP